MEGFLDPNKVLSQLDLSPNMIAADFGSGSGGWAIPLAKKLSSGKVFAIDILKEPLSALASRAKMEKVWNIQTICANVEDARALKLGEGVLDLVLMTNLLFQLENVKAVFSQAAKVLKKGGKVLVVDWQVDSSVGPEKGRLSPQTAKNVAQECGFALEKEFPAGPHHYGLVFARS